jgi:hypothetical protein
LGRSSEVATRHCHCGTDSGCGGGLLLVLGFVAQFDQALDWSPSWATLPWTLGVAAGTAICALPLLFVLRRWFVRRALYARLDESARRDEGRMTQMADSPRQFDQTALTFGILGIAKAKERRVVGKVPADLGASFIGKRRWQRLANERRLAPMVNKPFYGHEGWTLDEERPGGVPNT